MNTTLIDPTETNRCSMRPLLENLLSSNPSGLLVIAIPKRPTRGLSTGVTGPLAPGESLVLFCRVSSIEEFHINTIGEVVL